MADRLDTLARIQAACWSELVRAASHRGHAWRTPVLASLGAEGVDARTVVLREVEAASRRLIVYSDSRAAKVAELQQQPRAMLVFWSEQLQWQLRAVVQVHAVTAGLAVTSRWARLKMSPAAHDYLSPLPPGSATSPGKAAAAAAMAAITEARSDGANLAVLDAQVTSLDWLELAPQGHRRARFDDTGARWLQP